MSYPKAQPHDPPRQVAEDLFVVYGSIRMMPAVSVTRNMAIVRDGDELTLVNPVRMNDAGLAALDGLGKVRHVLRLGPMHGVDDPFYLDRYSAEFWSFADGRAYPVPDGSHPLEEGGPLPFGRAKLFAFNHLKQTEGAILLERNTNVLLTCDAVQSYAAPPHMPHTAKLSQALFSAFGFTRDTIIGPIWLKLLAADRAGLRGEFERLLEWDFGQLLSAHGTFVERDAHRALTDAFAKAFR